MRRVSASFIIVAPWILTVLFSVLGARLSWQLGVLAFLFSAFVAGAVARYLGHATRELRRELRSGQITQTEPHRIIEIDALRAAVRVASRESRQSAEQTVRTEEQLLAVIESVTEGILQISEHARIMRLNPAARELLNLPANAVGQTVPALIRHPELRYCIEQAATGQSFEPVEILFDERQLLVLPRPLRAFPGAVIAIVNLTEVRRLESVRRDFVANVSHELKTPLTSIRGYTETLLNEELPPEVRRQFLDVVHKNADRLQRIVDDLLDLSRLQSGGWQPELEQVDPVSLAEDVWSSCVGAQRKNIRFNVHANTARHVLADAGGLRQVLSNLFDNAIRYTPEGGEVTVSVRNGNGVNTDENYIELAVHDTGTGISRDALPRIFERFYRVDPARSRQEGGTGLGLSIVKHLVERMDGAVSAESELGKGTTIRIKLPAA
ncbi:MAG TPA: ATP-binding protein [Burkholderiales bacterium]|nr:ATP-binding protein [Burkholderiales bacterium]